MPLNSPTTLLYDLERGFRIWLISEIYMGPNSTGSGQIVPNVDDAVMDWNAGFYRVISVDTTGANPTYTPTLMLVDLSALYQQNSDINNGLALYQPSISELAFLNTTVTPYTVSIDDRYRVYGTEAAYAKLFKGTNLSSSGQVISQTFNGNGQFVSENIELELVDPNNLAIKRPPVFNTNVEMYDGETVTLVIYSQAGGVTGVHPFLIRNSSAIRGLAQPTVYITDVVLVTNMLDSTDLNLINAPANVPLTGGDFQARLLYSNGDSTLISIGSSKCKLYGIENFNTSLVGRESEIVLTYFADANEPVINVSNPGVKSISHKYRLRTVNNVSDFSFKIYVVPTYNAATQTYSNTYFLTNLAYDICIELNSSQISVSKLGGGTLNYGVNSGPQTFVLSVIMANLFPFGYAGYTFVQSVTISYGSIGGIGWVIDYLNTNTNVYGAQAYFEYSTQGQQAISIQSGALSIEEWFARLYQPLHTLYDETLMLAAPIPTHFQLRHREALSPIRKCSDYWDILLPNDFGGNWVDYDTVSIVWLQQTVDVNVYNTLGVTPVRIQNTLT